MASDVARIARLGAALSSESRAGIVCALMDGTARTNGELARHLRLSPAAVSEHVGVLCDAGLVCVEAQGRHRYVRLAGVATAELVEHLGVMAGTTLRPPQVPTGLRFARSCYRHLAGTLGVALLDALIKSGAVMQMADGLVTGPEAGRIVCRLGVDLEALPVSHRPLVRPCMDWSERRHHLAGSLGDALLASLLANGWVHRTPTPRALTLTASGCRHLCAALPLELP